MGKDDLLKNLLGKEKQNEEQTREREAMVARIEEERIRAQLKEERLQPSKIKAAAVIFKFANTLKAEGLCARIQAAYRLPRMYLFGGGWAHELPYKTEHGCWSRLETDGRTLTYWAGYKWMPSGPTLHFDAPDGLTVLAFDYLNDCEKAIKSGEIYDQIQRWYKRDPG